LTAFAAYRIALYVFLIHLYGFSRVRSEHLHFTDTPKGHPWPVSNGDLITKGQFLHFLILLAVWMVLFPITFRYIHCLLPMKKERDAG
jgi:hypothetical protein